MEWTNGKRKLSDLIPWDKNPRQLTQTQAKHLTESINKFGQVIPYSISPNNEIYDGHQRQHVMGMMETYGKDAEVDVRVSSRVMDEEERKEFVIRLHENTGEWDFDMLANDYDFESLKEWGMDEGLMDFLDFGEEPAEDPGAQIDKAEELREKWGVESGQMWQLGEHKIICGDCTDEAVVQRLMGGERAGAVVTDPPYGMDLDTDWSDLHGSLKSIGRANQTKGKRYDRVIGDDAPFDPTHIFELFGYCKEIFLFGGDYYAESIPARTSGSWLVWDKRKESQSEAIGAEFELIWSKTKHKRRMLRHDWFGFLSSRNTEDARNRVHPTQKPTTLIEDIIGQWAKEGHIIDLYLGSGTTLIACERLGRKCRGAEIEPKYVAVTLERWHDMTGGMPIQLDT